MAAGDTRNIFRVGIYEISDKTLSVLWQITIKRFLMSKTNDISPRLTRQVGTGEVGEVDAGGGGPAQAPRHPLAGEGAQRGPGHGGH